MTIAVLNNPSDRPPIALDATTLGIWSIRYHHVGNRANARRLADGRTWTVIRPLGGNAYVGLRLRENWRKHQR